MNSIAPIHESFFDLNQINLSSKADGASTARGHHSSNAINVKILDGVEYCHASLRQRHA